MTLTKLIDVLRKMHGSGYPDGYLRTPDGKLWEPVYVENIWRVDDTEDKIMTTVHLKPVTGEKK